MKSNKTLFLDCPKYTEILKYFMIYLPDNNTIFTNGYVKLDHIHDSIICNGVDMQAPIQHYIIKAKQFAINEQRLDKRKYEILKNNFKKELFITDIETTLLDYDFTYDEMQLINELFAGVTYVKSSIPRRKRKFLVSEIKRKILRN